MKGVLDATSFTDFDDRLLNMQAKWDAIESSIHPHKDPRVYHWILKNEAELSMIASVRVSAGLGSPPNHTRLIEMRA